MSMLAMFPLSSALQGPFSSLHFYLLALYVWLCVAAILGVCRGEVERKGNRFVIQRDMSGKMKQLAFEPPPNLRPSCVFIASGPTSLALQIDFIRRYGSNC